MQSFSFTLIIQHLLLLSNMYFELDGFVFKLNSQISKALEFITINFQSNRAGISSKSFFKTVYPAPKQKLATLNCDHNNCWIALCFDLWFIRWRLLISRRPKGFHTDGKFTFLTNFSKFGVFIRDFKPFTRAGVAPSQCSCGAALDI